MKEKESNEMPLICYTCSPKLIRQPHASIETITCRPWQRSYENTRAFRFFPHPTTSDQNPPDVVCHIQLSLPISFLCHIPHKLHPNLTGHVQLFQTTRAQEQKPWAISIQSFATGTTFVICCQRLAWIILLSTPNLDCMIMLNGMERRENQPNETLSHLWPISLVSLTY